MTNLDSAKRPFEVTFLGWLFIAVGIISTIYHLLKGSLDRWTMPIDGVSHRLPGEAVAPLNVGPGKLSLTSSSAMSPS